MSITRVAKLAGVSTSTVSRVINNHPRVAPETAKSVRKAMEQLKYTPSDRRPGPKPSLRTRTGASSIAFFVLGTSGGRSTPAFEGLLHGVSQAANSHGLNLVFTHVPDAEHLSSSVVSSRVDGALLHGALPGKELRQRLRDVPTVWLMGNRRRPEWGDQVMPDGYEVGELAAKYLLSHGHRHLAFLNLDGTHWALRLYGHAFSATAADAGVSCESVEQPREAAASYWQEHSFEAVERLVQRYLELSPRPTGIFVADDMQVALIQPAIQRHGVEIGPGKVQIVSCNNEKPYLLGLNPKPAEIDIRASSVGLRGVEQLIWRLEHPDVEERIVTTIEPDLVRPTNGALAIS
jgi:DNA-binding LacI/PurR family transcriptional regulator